MKKGFENKPYSSQVYVDDSQIHLWVINIFDVNDVEEIIDFLHEELNAILGSSEQCLIDEITEYIRVSVSHDDLNFSMCSSERINIATEYDDAQSTAVRVYKFLNEYKNTVVAYTETSSGDVMLDCIIFRNINMDMVQLYAKALYNAFNS